MITATVFHLERFGTRARRRLRRAGRTCDRFHCPGAVVAKAVVTAAGSPSVSWLECAKHAEEQR